MADERRPGSAGEHDLQRRYGTEARADRFYNDQVLDRLNETMIDFVGLQEMAFISTSDRNGECDSSFRAGEPGFIHVVDPQTVVYPEYRGNGVLASLGNIVENPHIGMLLIDFTDSLIGLHINGTARILEDDVLRASIPELPADLVKGRMPERWVVVDVEEAYIHCRKHIPRMVKADRLREWGSDNPVAKGGDFFGSKNESRRVTTS